MAIAALIVGVTVVPRPRKVGNFAWITHPNSVAGRQQCNLVIIEFDDERHAAGEGFNQLPAT